MPIIDTNTRLVYYQVVRYGFSHKNDSTLEEKFKLDWKCKKENQISLVMRFELAQN